MLQSPEVVILTTPRPSHVTGISNATMQMGKEKKSNRLPAVTRSPWISFAVSDSSRAPGVFVKSKIIAWPRELYLAVQRSDLTWGFPRWRGKIVFSRRWLSIKGRAGVSRIDQSLSKLQSKEFNFRFGVDLDLIFSKTFYRCFCVIWPATQLR
ncbi:hypothetical protein BKA83DRAFT_4289412 [Pisolithus microcarpus]|nr:hypothetical protein BKA83DRAFT_4289412 [Pisolithus microcarpus]